MLDERTKLALAPFDATQISEEGLEGEVAALLGRGASPNDGASVLRRYSGTDRRTARSGPENDLSVDQSTGTTNTQDAIQTKPDGTELSQLSIFVRNSNKQSLFTFIELEGYPILRIALDGQCHDLILNNDQVKLLLRQMTLWLTR